MKINSESIYTENDLERFLVAQQNHFQTALREIKQERKVSHWMWFVFPQIRGLGYSATAKFYGIQDVQEARAFYDDETLGKNMQELVQALLATKSSDATEIFGYPDDLKLRSSMTLFAKAVPEDPRFQQVLDKFYNGKMDEKTLQLL